MSAEKKLHVLVVEDNRINQVVVKGMLQHAGYETDAVFNGEQAIKALKNNCYDLVIMDCVMPIMDGFETTRRIRADISSNFDPDIPILAITALTAQEDRRKCSDCGMSGYISKPVVARDLFEWIRANLNTGPAMKGDAATVAAGAKAVLDTAEFIRKMSPVLLRDLKQWLRELRRLGDSNQLAELGALAHKIRGTGDVLGFSSLSEIATRLEKSAKAGDTINAFPQAEQLIEALHSLRREIQRTG